MAKGSKSSPVNKSKNSKKVSPSKKNKKGSPGKVELQPEIQETEIPSKIIDIHPNIPVKTNSLHWLDGPGFTVIINRCYTKDESMIFREILNLKLWDILTVDSNIDEYCRECIHGNFKDWPGTQKNEQTIISDVKLNLEAQFSIELPQWDFLHIENHLDEYNRDCCVHRGGTNLRNVRIAAIPNCSKYVNTHNIVCKPPTILKEIPPNNEGVAYAYLRYLGLQGPYNFAILKEIQKSFMNIKPVTPVSSTMIKRSTSNIKLGLVLSIVPGPYAFVLFVTKDSPADRACIQFADQICEVDSLPLNSRLALRRLTDNKSLAINVLYSMCPFKFNFNFEILEGESMGFQLVDGNVVYVKADTPAYEARFPVNHQIVELNNDCVVGLSNLDLQRQIRNQACIHPKRKVQITLVPRFIYEALIASIDPKYIRKRALNIFPGINK